MRKTTEQLMLDVHSKLNNAQVALMKQQVINELGEMSKEAVIEIIAKNIGCEMENREETKMEGIEKLNGCIEGKNQTDGMKNGKPWKRWTYKLGNSNLTLATFTDFPFNVGQNVKIVYKDNVVGDKTYHNIENIEVDAVDVVKQETIVDVPKEAVKLDSVIKYDSMNLSYFSAKSGLSLTEQINDFGKSHNVKATQTHVYGSYDSNANPEAVFCAFVWWK